MSLQQVIRKAFQNVKKDITEIKDKLQKLTEKQEHLEASLASLQSKQETVMNVAPERELVQITTDKKPKKPSKKKK